MAKVTVKDVECGIWMFPDDPKLKNIKIDIEIDLDKLNGAGRRAFYSSSGAAYYAEGGICAIYSGAHKNDKTEDKEDGKLKQMSFLEE